ncbi:MAG: NADH-quinone oxidoreductase subunit L, partial [Alphaproteobacteria bacterium]
MTAFYSWRLIFMTFHGKPRADKQVMKHVHESPPVMLAPLIPLALGAIFAGLVGHHVWHMVDGTDAFWQGSLVVLPAHNALAHLVGIPGWAGLLPLALALCGIALAYLFYMKRPDLPGKLAGHVHGLYEFLLHKWYFDELYGFLFVRNAFQRGKLAVAHDRHPGHRRSWPNGAAVLSRAIALRTSRFETGYLYHYAFVMLAGLVVLVGLLVYAVLGR